MTTMYVDEDDTYLQHDSMGKDADMYNGIYNNKHCKITDYL